MWLILFAVFIICAMIGIGTFVVLKMKSTQRDIFQDFKVIKRALIEFRKAKSTKCEDIGELRKWLVLDADYLVNHYELQDGERFLVYKGNVSRELANEIIQKVGGHSRYDESKKMLFLALLQFKISEFDPIAVISYFPKDNLSTTTKIEWKYEDSKVEGREILEVEWQNCQERYDLPGNYVVGLRVKDRNGNWSDWVETEIVISEEKGIKGIASGLNHLVRYHFSGKIDVQGKNKFGQLGDSTFNDSDYLKRIFGFDNVAQVSCGDAHTLFKHYDGSASACGNNEYGQLGNGNRNHSKSPQKIWGLEQVKQLAAGSDYSIALLATGGVLSWGNNEFGQLGEEKSGYRELPKRVKDVSRVKQISVSGSHVVATLHDGTVMSWGENSHGQLGAGFKSRTSEPIITNVAGVFYSAAGKNFSVFVLDTGKVKVLGSNQFGQLGIASEPTVAFTKEIPELKNIVKAVAYESFTLALTDVGEVYTWGRYSSKDGETYYKPQKIANLKYVKDIACSATKGYALLEDGHVVYWSGNLDASEYVDDIKKT